MTSLLGERPILLHRQVVRRSGERTVYVLAVLKDIHGIKARLYGEGGSRSVELVDEQPAVSVQRVARTTTVQLADGSTWTFEPGGCACGSPLKHFNPLAGHARRAGT